MAVVAVDLPPSVYQDEAQAEVAWAQGWQSFVLEREQSQASQRAAALSAPAALRETAAPWRKHLRSQVYPEHYLIGALVSGAFLLAGSTIGLV